MKLIYVAGKYSGKNERDKQDNILKAREAAIKLLKLGWAVITPHLNTCNFDWDMPGYNWLEMDLVILERCDYVFFLEGYKDSAGALIELAHAVNQKTPQIYEEIQGFISPEEVK